jgi:hypothetical protein
VLFALEESVLVLPIPRNDDVQLLDAALTSFGADFVGAASVVRVGP